MKRLLFVLIVALTACDDSPADRRARSLEAPISAPAPLEVRAPQKPCPQFDELSPAEQTMIQNKRVLIGMRPIAVICMRGSPINVVKDRTAAGERMTYFYQNEAVMFSTEGVVTYITERF